MNQIFFVDIDTQRDFMLPSGALYVPGAEKLVPKLRRLFEFARRHGIFVLSSVDAHAPDDPEFMQFPPHCVRGTEGQRKLDETLLHRPLILENKPMDRNLMDALRKHSQIIIEKQKFDVFSNPVTGKLLRALPAHAIVFGVATDYCVRAAALGLRNLGIKTAVVSDAIRAVAADTERQAIEEMRQAGVEFSSVDQVLDAYAA
jgi:nicotinamidase/pyrazinamidase